MVAKNFGGCVTLGPQTNRILGRIVGAALAPLSGHLPPHSCSPPIGNATFSPSLSTAFHRNVHASLSQLQSASGQLPRGSGWLNMDELAFKCRFHCGQ